MLVIRCAGFGYGTSLVGFSAPHYPQRSNGQMCVFRIHETRLVRVVATTGTGLVHMDHAHRAQASEFTLYVRCYVGRCPTQVTHRRITPVRNNRYATSDSVCA